MLAEDYDPRVFDSLTLGPDPVRALLGHPNCELGRGGGSLWMV